MKKRFIRKPYKLMTSEEMRSLNEDFSFDLHLSHNSVDKLLVRRSEVWLAEWAVKPGDIIQAKIQEWQKPPCVLLLRISAGKRSSV